MHTDDRANQAAFVSWAFLTGKFGNSPSEITRKNGLITLRLVGEMVFGFVSDSFNYVGAYFLCFYSV